MVPGQTLIHQSHLIVRKFSLIQFQGAPNQ
jgi:hypothetical protein